MKVLNREELQIAEGVLLKHFPKSFKVYGFLYGINRNKPTALQVVVDMWPDFKVIICRPNPGMSSNPIGKLFTSQNKCALNFEKDVTYYSTDEQTVKKMLTEENVVDWSTYFLITGADLSCAPMLKQVSSDRRVSHKIRTFARLLYLPDINDLCMPMVNRFFQNSVQQTIKRTTTKREGILQSLLGDRKKLEEVALYIEATREGK